MTYAHKMRPKSAQAWGSGGTGELALLTRIRACSMQTHRAELKLGIGDDCALLRLRPHEDLAVTTDLSIEGRHFRLGWHPAEAIGHRTLARGLSDLAAMGARPIAAFLSLGLPRSLAQKTKGRELWLDRFLEGFFALAEAHQTPLAGGDLAESPMVVADIVLTGAVRRKKALLRSGAGPGDLIYVTGSLGGSAAGLARMAQWAAAPRQGRSPKKQFPRLLIPVLFKKTLGPHLYPQPRIAQGLWLAAHSRASAAIDLSDGLSTDLTHLCEESGVAAEVQAAALPVHAAATMMQALHGGEDYELLFTAPPGSHLPRSIGGVPVSRIGQILKRDRSKPIVTLRTERGAQSLTPQGWEHFS
jgi:thiamine-monophosphate kinase